MQINEIVWYNGEMSCYELLDFDPMNKTKVEIIKEAKQILKKKYGFNKEEMKKAMETLYFLNIDGLTNVVDKYVGSK